MGTSMLFQSIASRKDRKSTRLNSSHTVISYAVFCLKKKNKNINNGIQYGALLHGGVAGPAVVLAEPVPQGTEYVGTVAVNKSLRDYTHHSDTLTVM